MITSRTRDAERWRAYRSRCFVSSIIRSIGALSGWPVPEDIVVRHMRRAMLIAGVSEGFAENATEIGPMTKGWPDSRYFPQSSGRFYVREDVQDRFTNRNEAPPDIIDFALAAYGPWEESRT